MNKPDEILELYTFVEKNFDVSKFTYKSINVWPLIRAQVGIELNLLKPQQKLKKLTRKKKISDFIKTPYRFLKLAAAKKKFLNSVEILQSEVQIITYPQKIFIDKVENKNYSRYIDPYYEVLKTEYPTINRLGFLNKDEVALELNYPTQNNKLATFIDYIELKNYIQSYSRDHKKNVNNLISVFTEANDLVYKKYNIKPFHTNLIASCTELVNYKIYFDALFKKSNTKLVFLDCFYDTFKMALSASAKKFNIKTVEIQHGGAEDNVYVPYLNHAINYSILPDLLWCWSNSDKDLILKHNGSFKYLIPFIGGNMWLKKFIHKEIDIETKSETTFFSELKNTYQKIILVCLQPTFINSEVIFNVITNAPNNYFFLVRFHPFNTEVEKQMFKNKLRHHTNFETEISTKTNLFLLFKNSNFQLTHSSTTAMEALAFNLPTVICSSYGYDFYREQIKDNVILFSTEYQQILSFFENENLELNKAKMDYYMVKSNPTESIKNLKQTLSLCAA